MKLKRGFPKALDCFWGRGGWKIHRSYQNSNHKLQSSAAVHYRGKIRTYFCMHSERARCLSKCLSNSYQISMRFASFLWIVLSRPRWSILTKLTLKKICHIWLLKERGVYLVNKFLRYPLLFLWLPLYLCSPSPWCVPFQQRKKNRPNTAFLFPTSASKFVGWSCR